MFWFLVIFGLAAIVLMLIVAKLRGRRDGVPSGGGSSADAGAGFVAGWSTDWDRRTTDSSPGHDAGDWGGGSTDSGGGASDAGGGGGDGGDGGGD